MAKTIGILTGGGDVPGLNPCIKASDFLPHLWVSRCFCINLLLLCNSPLAAQTADEYTRQASQLIQNYQWKEAVVLLESGLRHYPDDPVLLLGLGSVLINLGQTAQGEELLQKALRIRPEDPDLLRTTGEAQLRQGKLTSAITLFQKALQHRSNDAAAHYRLAFSLFLENDEKRALEHARRAIEANPLHPSYRRLYALLLDSQNQSRESYRQLRLAHQLAPRDASLLFQLSQNRKDAGELAQALEYLELASELDPENPLYHSELSRLLERIGEKQSAAGEAETAKQLQLSFGVYLECLRLVSKRRDQDAIRRLEPVVQNNPQFVTGTMLLADLYRKSGQEKPALDLYLKILERNPHHTPAREQGAWIEVKQGSLERALKLLRESHEESPNTELFQGYHKLAEQNWSEALEHFRTVELNHPLDPRLLQLMSLTLSAQGKSEEALRYLSKAERLEPGNPNIRTLAQTIQADEAYQLLTSAYRDQQLGNLNSAIESYRRGLRLDPHANWARMNLATCLYRMGTYREAASEWEHLLSKQKSSQAYFQLGLCYSHLERLPEAEQAFRKSASLGNENGELLYNLGIVQMRQRKTEEAWRLIRRSAATGYEPARQLLQRAQAH